jgi:uncharacterized membrane protein
MKILNEKDIKRNTIVCFMLVLSLFLVPFAENIGVKILLGIVLLLLVINSIMIISKVILYHKKCK